MTLKEFKDHVQAFPQGTVFEYGISEPFSWRGSYDEVAFSIEEKKMTREEVLKRINMAFEDTFEGYKGGEYKYNDYTPVNFEDAHRSYTDGQYTSEWIAKIEGTNPHPTQEHRLVNLIFKS